MAGKSYNYLYVKRDVSPVIEDLKLMSPTYLSLFTLGNGIGTNIATARKHEWHDVAIGPTVGVLASDANVGQTTVVLGTGHGARFAAGDEIAFKGGNYEVGIIDSITDDTLTMIANLTATQASGTEIVLVSRKPPVEGGYSDSTGLQQGDQFYNYCQTFSRSYQESEESQAEMTEDQLIGKLQLHARRKMDELYREMSTAALLGVRAGPEADATRSRAGGLLYFINQNPDVSYKIDAQGEELDDKMINNLSQVLQSQSRVLVCHSDMQRQISKMNAVSGGNRFIIVNQESAKGGVAAVNQILTDIPSDGAIVTMVDDAMPRRIVAICDPARQFYMPLNNLSMVDESRNAEYRGAARAIKGTYTFEFRDVFYTAGMIYNLKAFSA